MASGWSRKWKAQEVGDWCLVKAESKCSKVEEETTHEEEVKVEDKGPKLSVYLLTQSSVFDITCKPGERILRIRAMVAKELGVKSGEVVLLYNGDKVEDAFPLTRILEGSGRLGAAVTTVKPLILSTTKIGKDVTISADRLSISSTDPDYCSNTAMALSEYPIPNMGVYRFGIQIGEELGCYDGIGFAPPSHDMTTMCGSTEDSWLMQLCYRRTHHAGSYNRWDRSRERIRRQEKLQITVDRRAGTVSFRRPSDGMEFENVIDNLANVPLHLCLNVCPHDGQTSLTIIPFDSC